jgi:hypothetical protein
MCVAHLASRISVERNVKSLRFDCSDKVTNEIDKRIDRDIYLETSPQKYCDFSHEKKQYMIQQTKEWQKKNTEHRKAYCREYYRKNKARKLEAEKLKRKSEDGDKIRAKHREYAATYYNKKKNEPDYEEWLKKRRENQRAANQRYLAKKRGLKNEL